jgi:large subunit ribosomal protein L10
LRRAINGTRFEGLGRYLEGPTAVAFAFEDASSVARVLVDYAKDNEKLGLKGGVVEGEVLDAKGIEALSKLPSKLELRGMLAGTLQAPLRNVAGTLYALLGHVRNALEQRQQKLEAQ